MWIIVGGNTVDGQAVTFFAGMDQHQLAAIGAIFLAGMLDCQPDGLHQRLAGRKPVSRHVQVQVTRPEAIRTMVAVMNAREPGFRANETMTVSTHEAISGGFPFGLSVSIS